MAPDELGCRMNHDVCSVFDRTDEIRCSEGVVDDQRQAVSVGYFSYGIDIRNVAVRVAQCFQENGSGVLLNGTFHFTEVVGIYECG